MLIAEDNGDDAYYLGRLLTQAGQRFDIVDSAGSAMALLSQKHYPVLFLDMRLPGMQGWDFINKLAEQFPRTHVIAVCGELHDLEHIEAGIYFGAIRKPVRPLAVATLLKQLRL